MNIYILKTPNSEDYRSPTEGDRSLPDNVQGSTLTETFSKMIAKLTACLMIESRSCESRHFDRYTVVPPCQVASKQQDNGLTFQKRGSNSTAADQYQQSGDL